MRRVKKPLLVTAAGALLVLSILPLTVAPLTQTGSGGASAGGQNRNSRNRRAGAGSEPRGASANTANSAGTNAPLPSPSRQPRNSVAPGAEADDNASNAGRGAGAGTQQSGSPAAVVPTEETKSLNANQPAEEAIVAPGTAASGVPWEFIVGGTGFALGLAALALIIHFKRKLSKLEEKVYEQPVTLKQPQQRLGIEDLRPKTARSYPMYGDGQTLRGGAEAGDATSLDELPHRIAQRFEELEIRVKELEEQLAGDEDEDVVEAVSFPNARTTIISDEFDESLADRPPQSVTVEKMVAWANGAGLRLEPVKAAFGLFGNFTRSEEGDNWLVSSGGDGESYLFPRVNRFESASHFRSAYNDYYDCAQPSAGTVVVEQPALVSSDPQGGWKLKDKGRLSVTS